MEQRRRQAGRARRETDVLDSSILSKLVSELIKGHILLLLRDLESLDGQTCTHHRQLLHLGLARRKSRTKGRERTLSSTSSWIVLLTLYSRATSRSSAMVKILTRQRVGGRSERRSEKSSRRMLTVAFKEERGLKSKFQRSSSLPLINQLV
jgi:hypothetical protein